MVFVEESAEQVASMHPSWLAVANDTQVGGSIRRFQSERPVGTVVVVVLDVDAEHLLKVTAPANQQPVQALGPHRADPALGVGVGVGACTGVTSASVPSDKKTSSKAVELRIPIADEEPQPPIPKHQQQVAGLLGNPSPVRVGGHAGQVNPSSIQFDEEQHLQPSEPVGCVKAFMQLAGTRGASRRVDRVGVPCLAGP
jgi:hypothetical protein